jgi:hypothetical protein
MDNRRRSRCLLPLDNDFGDLQQLGFDDVAGCLSTPDLQVVEPAAIRFPRGEPAERSRRGIVSNVAAMCGEIWRWVGSVSTVGGGAGIVMTFAVRSKSTLPCRQGDTILPTALYVPL